eukprot:TRINITY_DN6391_c0_g1_i1.p1 TRINITY_DN6391_c0_g1~~TRINITY_DN6391_c0_g1_i1.p1  ORF type:complete len:378 (+),score=75.70 TRINITY_DN6391_c0_g1_i1:78-1136(+)
MGSLFSSRPMNLASISQPYIVLLGGYQSGKRTFVHWVRELYDLEPRDTPLSDQVILSENLKDSLHFLASDDLDPELRAMLSEESRQTLTYIKTFSYIFLSETDMEKVLDVLRDPALPQILTYENLRKWKKFSVYNKQLLQRLEKIGTDFVQKDFTPKFEDTLVCLRNLITSNLVSAKLDPASSPEAPSALMTVVLCPGPRSLRHHWLPELAEASDILFFCNLSEFDLMLREDPQTNRTAETLFIWKWLCTRKELRHCKLKIIFTMPDLLRQKLEAGIRIADFVPAFTSEAKDPDEISKAWVEFLKKEFALAAVKLELVFEGPVSLLDVDSASATVKKLIGNRYLREEIEEKN